MENQLQQALTFLPLVLGCVLLLCLMPVASPSKRQAMNWVMFLGALGLMVYGALQGSDLVGRELINMYQLKGQEGPTEIVMGTVQAPAWRWPVTAGCCLLLPVLLTWILRNRPAGSPGPGSYCGMLGIWVFASRLLLEHAAAPQGLVWALGPTMALPVLAFFLGGYVAARGKGFKSLMGAALVMGLLHVWPLWLGVTWPPPSTGEPTWT